MVKLNTLYRLIKKTYAELEEKKNIQCQYFMRKELNSYICEYVANGGKRDIKKYCKYYV